MRQTVLMQGTRLVTALSTRLYCRLTCCLTGLLLCVPDILALSATTSNVGITVLDANNQAAFSVAPLNLGAESDTLRVDAFPTGGLAAFTTSICETKPVTGDCLGAAARFVEVDYDEVEERTFGVLVSSSQPIEPLFDIRRVRVQFTDDAGELRGSTSVAVVTQL